MFLRATEMNPTDISLGGFFDVNRILFKSVSKKNCATYFFFNLMLLASSNYGNILSCAVTISN